MRHLQASSLIVPRISLCIVQNFNNTRHDYEITLEPSSIVELCPDEEAVIPKIQYHVSTLASSISLSILMSGMQLALRKLLSFAIPNFITGLGFCQAFRI